MCLSSVSKHSACTAPTHWLFLQCRRAGKPSVSSLFKLLGKESWLLFLEFYSHRLAQNRKPVNIYAKNATYPGTTWGQSKVIHFHSITTVYLTTNSLQRYSLHPISLFIIAGLEKGQQYSLGTVPLTLHSKKENIGNQILALLL